MSIKSRPSPRNPAKSGPKWDDPENEEIITGPVRATASAPDLQV